MRGFYLSSIKGLIRCRKEKFLDRDIRCATVEGLILVKLSALPLLYRQGGFERVGIYENDLASLLYVFNPNMEPLLDELSRYLDDTDMTEAKQIVTDIEARIQKSQKARVIFANNLYEGKYLEMATELY